MAIVQEQQPTLGVAPVCHALAIPRASYYRWRVGAHLKMNKSELPAE
jgi:hypothetical protein